MDAPFLAIYESLIPAEEEKAKQKQLLTLLEKLVCKHWPKAKLYLYGSCGNSFGVLKSDIDVCLAIDDPYLNKVVMLVKLAEILKSSNLQDVQVNPVNTSNQNSALYLYWFPYILSGMVYAR